MTITVNCTLYSFKICYRLKKFNLKQSFIDTPVLITQKHLKPITEFTYYYFIVVMKDFVLVINANLLILSELGYGKGSKVNILLSDKN